MTHVSTSGGPERPGVAPATDDYLGDRVTDALLAFLENRRQELGLGHNVFARDVLHMSQTAWSQVRRGNHPAGPAFIGRVVAAVPESAAVIRAAQEKAQGGA